MINKKPAKYEKPALLVFCSTKMTTFGDCASGGTPGAVACTSGGTASGTCAPTGTAVK